MEFQLINRESITVNDMYTRYRQSNLYPISAEVLGKDLAYFELKFLALVVLPGIYQAYEEPLNLKNKAVLERFEKIKAENVSFLENADATKQARKIFAQQILCENIDFYCEFVEKERERRAAIVAGHKPKLQLDGQFFSLKHKNEKIAKLKEDFKNEIF